MIGTDHDDVDVPCRVVEEDEFLDDVTPTRRPPGPGASRHLRHVLHERHDRELQGCADPVGADVRAGDRLPPARGLRRRRRVVHAVPDEPRRREDADVLDHPGQRDGSSSATVRHRRVLERRRRVPLHQHRPARCDAGVPVAAGAPRRRRRPRTRERLDGAARPVPRRVQGAFRRSGHDVVRVGRAQRPDPRRWMGHQLARPGGAAGRCGTGFPGTTCAWSTSTTTRSRPDAVGELVVRTSEPWTHERGLPRDAGEDGRGVAERLVPHRRRVHATTATATSSSSTAARDCIRRRGENISSFEVETEVERASPGRRERGDRRAVRVRGGGDQAPAS